MHAFLLFLHLASVIVWVGGMFFAHICLRPVVNAQLQPPQRLQMMASILGRFFPIVAKMIVILFISGFALMSINGFAHAPLNWHLMMALGLTMAAIFSLIYIVFFRRLQGAVAEQDWPKAALAMNRTRQLVLLNLCLGILTTGIATLGGLLG